MNIVFWLLIIVALVLLWFAMGFCFDKIGGAGLKLFNSAKDAMIEEQGDEDSGSKQKD